MRAPLWLTLVVAACAADPATPGSPSVSGESHFLSPCVETAECGAALSCLCGVCTVACDDDAVCADVASGAVCGGKETCGEAPGGRICGSTSPPGDAGRPPSDAAPALPPLETLEIESGFGPCNPGPALPTVPRALGGCWSIEGVRAPETLVLTDSQGTVTLPIDAAAFATVEAITRTDDFARLVGDAEACGPTTDGDSTLRFQRRGEAAVTLEHLHGCPPNPARDALYDALRTLRAANLVCPLPVEPPLPQRFVCFGCEACEHTDCPGVVVEAGAESYCVGPASSRFSCPPRWPAAVALNGTVVCAAEPGLPDDLTARRVAREALQTALVQSRAHVERLDLPAEATHWPGLSPGSEVWATARVVDSGTAWFSGDEGPISCGEAFDHFEVVETNGAAGPAFELSGWNTVVECGLPQMGIVAELHPEVYLRAPAEPGVYPITVWGTAESAPGPTLLVDVADACPAAPPALESCFTGLLFADCGGALPPAIFCGPEQAPCLWFTGGCPAAGYGLPVECHGETTCPSWGLGWGLAPWNRDRDMALTLSVDPALEAPPAAPEVDCACETPPCLEPGAAFCDEARAMYEVGFPMDEPPESSQRGLIVVAVLAEVGGSDWALTLEADPERGTGRACLFQMSDAENGGPPVCATAGSATLDRVPATRGEVRDVHGRLTATFDEIPGQRRQSVTIDVAF